MDDVHGAEDVTSEAMLVWVQHIGETSREAGQLAAWLRQVVHHKAVDYYRHAERGRRAIDRVMCREQDASRENDPRRSLETTELLELDEALARLSESQRLVLEWKYVDGLSVRQIAQRLGVSEKAVEARLYRAREEVREQYTGREVGRRHSSLMKADGNGHPSPPRSGSTI